jgi:hypothetical protein
MVRTWGRQLPAQKVRVVTVSREATAPHLLWERFAGAIDLDPGVCSEPARQANRSLGYASAELLRRVNVELGRLRPSDYDATLKNYLAARVLSEPTWDEPRIRLDGPTYDFGLTWNQRNRDAVSRRATVLFGDLEDLPTTVGDTRRPRGCRDDDREADDPPTDAMLAAAEAASEALHLLIRRRARRLRDRGAADRTPPVELSPDARPATWSLADDPVDAAARDLAGLARTAMDLHARLNG